MSSRSNTTNLVDHTTQIFPRGGDRFYQYKLYAGKHYVVCHAYDDDEVLFEVLCGSYLEARLLMTDLFRGSGAA